MSQLEIERRVFALTEGEADPAFRRRAAWVLSRLDLAGDRRVLELGCGVAPLLTLAFRIAPVFGVGVDVDMARLLGARSRCGSISPVLADAASLPFRDGVFDAVIASEVLEHLVDDRIALRELGRCTSGAGAVAVTVPNAEFPASWDPVGWLLGRLGLPPLRRGPYVGIWTGHRRLYRRGDLHDAARGAGFTVREDAALVVGSFPFAHFLLYGVGRWLLLAGLLDRRSKAAVDRSEAGGALSPAWHPVGFAVRLFRACDERAQRKARPDGPSVHLAALLGRGVNPSR